MHTHKKKSIFKDDPDWVFRMGTQTTDHLIWECADLPKQGETQEQDK